VRLGIVVESARVSAVALRRGRTVWAAEAPYAGAEDLERALAGLAAERPGGARSASVGLADDVARVKIVEGLPRLSPADLAAHVRLHSRRYFLQNGVPLVTDATPLGKTHTGRALLAAAHVPVIEAIAGGLRGAGLVCRTIVPLCLLSVPAGDPLAATRAVALARDARLALLPEAARADAVRATRRSLTRWAALAAGSVATLVVTWFAVQLRQERAAAQELVRLRPALQVALNVRTDLDGATDALALLSRASSGRARRARLLAALTRALPDSAFLVSVRLEPDGRGTLAGYAPSAASVVARLERAGAVQRAVLEGSVTREVVAGRERERFAVRFDLPSRTEVPR